MDKLFGIDVSKKADFDDELEAEKQASARKTYASPMTENEAEVSAEMVEDAEYGDIESIQPVMRQDVKPKTKTVSGMDVDYGHNDSPDSKEIL